MRNRRFSASEIYEIEDGANSLGEVGEIVVEAEISANKSVATDAPDLWARQEGNVEPTAIREPENLTMSTNQLLVLLLDVVRSLKADVGTAVEILSSDSKVENVKLAAEIISSLISQLTSKFRAENQKLAEQPTAKFQTGKN